MLFPFRDRRFAAARHPVFERGAYTCPVHESRKNTGNHDNCGKMGRANRFQAPFGSASRRIIRAAPSPLAYGFCALSNQSLEVSCKSARCRASFSESALNIAPNLSAKTADIIRRRAHIRCVLWHRV